MKPIKPCTCLRCGTTWMPRLSRLPKRCTNPHCRSPYWNVLRRVKA